MFLLFSGRDGRPCAHWCYWGEKSQTAPSRTTIIKWKRGKRIKREINFKYFLTFQFPVLPSVLPPAGCESSNCESIGAGHWGSWISGNYIGIHCSMRIWLHCHSYLFEVNVFPRCWKSSRGKPKPKLKWSLSSSSMQAKSSQAPGSPKSKFNSFPKELGN